MNVKMELLSSCRGRHLRLLGASTWKEGDIRRVGKRQQRSPGNARNKSSDLVELGPLASYDLTKIPSRARRVFKTGEEPGVMYS